VRVYYRFQLRAVELYAVFLSFQSNEELGRVHLGSPRPYPACLIDYGAQGQWTDPVTFQGYRILTGCGE
jgi:hypothetical protein